MKKTFLISILLTFALAASEANALVTESVSITETGSIVVSGEASASGGDDASASVQSTVRSDGNNTNVRIDIRTLSDGEEYATTVSKTIQSEARVENKPQVQVSVERSDRDGGEETETQAVQIKSTSALERFSSIFTSFFRFLFFW